MIFTYNWVPSHRLAWEYWINNSTSYDTWYIGRPQKAVLLWELKAAWHVPDDSTVLKNNHWRPIHNHRAKDSASISYHWSRLESGMSGWVRTAKISYLGRKTWQVTRGWNSTERCSSSALGGFKAAGLSGVTAHVRVGRFAWNTKRSFKVTSVVQVVKCSKYIGATPKGKTKRIR